MTELATFSPKALGRELALSVSSSPDFYTLREYSPPRQLAGISAGRLYDGTVEETGTFALGVQVGTVAMFTNYTIY